MAGITGARGTGNTSALLKKDVAQTVAELEPESAPLTVLLNRIPTRRATHNPTYSHFEDDREDRFDAINNGGGYLSTDTALTVDTGALFAQHFLVQITRTGEMVRVVDRVGNVITVVRGVGSTAAAINDDDELMICGIAKQEGDTPRQARSSNPVEVSNYTQIEETPYESTETLRHSDQWTSPNDWTRQAKKAGVEHAVSMEFDAWHGKPSVNTAGEHPRRTTGGVLHFVTTNATDAGGALTEAELYGALRPGFRYGTKTKTAFAAALPVDVINAYPRGKLQINQGETTYGLRVMQYISPHGTLNVITNWLFEGSKYGGYIVILDLPNIGKRFLANENGSRDTHVVPNVQVSGQDSKKDQLLTEWGMEVKNEKTHGFIYGITS